MSHACRKCCKTLTFCPHLARCRIPCACHARPHLNLQKSSEHVVFVTFWLGNVLRATTACPFSRCQLPKVLRTWCVSHILTSKCASRHNGMHFFDISTSKSVPRPSVFNAFHWNLQSLAHSLGHLGIKIRLNRVIVTKAKALRNMDFTWLKTCTARKYTFFRAHFWSPGTAYLKRTCPHVYFCVYFLHMFGAFAMRFLLKSVLFNAFGTCVSPRLFFLRLGVLCRCIYFTRVWRRLCWNFLWSHDNIRSC